MLKKIGDIFYIAFIDLVFLLLFGIFILLMLLLLLITENENRNTQKNAEFMVTSSWSETVDCDIDTWTEMPNGTKVSFVNRDSPLVTLERDDRGVKFDTIVVNGEPIKSIYNEEAVIFRGHISGTYTVNVHLYNCLSSIDFNEPIPVDVQFIKINPKYQVLRQATVVLDGKWDEKTAFTFSLDDEGNFIYIGDDYRKIIDLKMYETNDEIDNQSDPSTLGER